MEKERTGVGRYLINLLQQWNKLNFPRKSAGAASAVGKRSTNFPAAQRVPPWRDERSALISVKNSEGLHSIDNLKFILYFHKSIPDDDFLDNPIFEKKLLKSPYQIKLGTGQVWPKPSFLVYFLFLLPLSLKKDKVDLAFFPGYMVPMTYFGKSVIVLHDVAFFAHPEWFIFRFRLPYQIFSWFGAKISKKIITVSEFSKKEVLKYCKVNPEKIFVTPLGVDEKFEIITDEIILDNVKRKYRIKKYFALQLGQIFYRRHVLETISAFEKVAKKLPDFQLLVVGKNWLKENLEEIIEKTNLKIGRNAIIWQKFVSDEDLVLLYNAAGLSLYLSDYEGFGLPPLEAMACGTPVLTTGFAALGEISGDCALVVEDPQNPTEIAKKIYLGLTDMELRNELIKKGLEKVKKYSWEKCAKETLNILLN